MSSDGEIPRASGALIAKERKVLEELVGEAPVRQALAKLPAEIRSEYEAITPLTKIPTDTVERVYEAVAEQAGRDVFRMHRDVVRLGVEQALKSSCASPATRRSSDERRSSSTGASAWASSRRRWWGPERRRSG